jgi:hypothetical protein
VLSGQHAQEPQTNLVAKQPIQRAGLFHIHKYTFMDTRWQEGSLYVGIRDWRFGTGAELAAHE